MQYELLDKTGYAKDGSRHYFLLADGVPVTYVKVYPDYADGIPVSLADIETRPEYKRQGFATKALQMIAEKYGVDSVHHDGGYTPEGFAFIKPLVSGCDAVKPEFREQFFVMDWDNLVRKYI